MTLPPEATDFVCCCRQLEVAISEASRPIGLAARIVHAASQIAQIMVDTRAVELIDWWLYVSPLVRRQAHPRALEAAGPVGHAPIAVNLPQPIRVDAAERIVTNVGIRVYTAPHADRIALDIPTNGRVIVAEVVVKGSPDVRRRTGRRFRKQLRGVESARAGSARAVRGFWTRMRVFP
jgi:hypothetical protein